MKKQRMEEERSEARANRRERTAKRPQSRLKWGLPGIFSREMQEARAAISRATTAVVSWLSYLAPENNGSQQSKTLEIAKVACWIKEREELLTVFSSSSSSPRRSPAFRFPKISFNLFIDLITKLFQELIRTCTGQVFSYADEQWQMDK